MVTKKLSIADILIGVFMIIICIIMVYPFWHVLMGSFMNGTEYLQKNVLLWVNNPALDNYKYLLAETDTLLYILNTVFIAVFGTVLSVFFTTYSAYALSKNIPGIKFIFLLVVATMFIDPGLIPNYINFKDLGLINTRAVLIIIAVINPFFLIIMRSNFIEFPKELEESARIDGAGINKIFFQIVFPLSTAMIAAITVFIAVNYWNTYLPSVFFISDPDKKTIQDYLGSLLTQEQLAVDAAQAVNQPLTTMLKFASIILGALPILVVYPFMQRYFVKGALIGAVKG
ncbi:MAG: carbohydrate ABC transporter permease [Sphaerochaetaceae bacterium]|nr:carbohydrate ABC transporter permease [Sphaerochaetaceae bacterium]